MSTLSLKHPFIDGCKNKPEDWDEKIQPLREWTKSQVHLPQLTDEHLIMFLHCNYEDLKKAQNNITRYFEIRRGNPTNFTGLTPLNPGVKGAWDISYQIQLPKTTPEGYNVLFTGYTDYDPSRFNFLDCTKATYLFYDVQISENGLSPGYIAVMDNSGFTFSHFLKMRLNPIRVMMRYIQEGNPIRLKAMHIINAVPFIDKVFALFKPFMGSSLISMMHIHGSDLTEFYKAVPQEILPKDYGGLEDSLVEMRKKYHNMVTTKYCEWLEEQESFVMDTSKLPKAENQSSFLSGWFGA